MTPDEAAEREEIAQRLERAADRYQNAGDTAGAQEALSAARRVRMALTIQEARSVAGGTASGLQTQATPGGCLGFGGGSRTYDDS